MKRNNEDERGADVFLISEMSVYYNWHRVYQTNTGALCRYRRELWFAQPHVDIASGHRIWSLLAKQNIDYYSDQSRERVVTGRGRGALALLKRRRTQTVRAIGRAALKPQILAVISTYIKLNISVLPAVIGWWALCVKVWLNVGVIELHCELSWITGFGLKSLASL